jgi:hypothetical protein
LVDVQNYGQDVLMLLHEPAEEFESVPMEHEPQHLGGEGCT